MSFLRHNIVAKFQFPSLILSRDILHFVICLNTVTTYEVINFLICIIQNLNNFGMSEGIAKLKTPPFFILKGLSNKLNLVFTSLAL